MAPLVLAEEPAPQRPQAHAQQTDRSAMTAELCEALHGELRAAAADRSCRVLILDRGRAWASAPVWTCTATLSARQRRQRRTRDRLANQQHMSTLGLGLRACRNR